MIVYHHRTRIGYQLFPVVLCKPNMIALHHRCHLHQSNDGQGCGALQQNVNNGQVCNKYTYSVEFSAADS
jgi:hypothetical protein